MTGNTRTAADASDTAVDARCTVCEHSLVAHDPISLRYCRATQTQALTRGCICRTAN